MEIGNTLLEKARSKKYIRRVPKSGGGYRYIYREEGGKAPKKPEEKQERERMVKVPSDFDESLEDFTRGITGAGGFEGGAIDDAHKQAATTGTIDRDTLEHAANELYDIASRDENKGASNLARYIEDKLLKKSQGDMKKGWEIHEVTPEAQPPKKPFTRYDKSITGNDVSTLGDIAFGGRPWNFHA